MTELLVPQGHWLACVLLAVAVCAGCDPSTLCDADQTYSNGLCYAPDAPAPTADADPRFAHFGDECTVNANCAAPAGFCAIQPPAPTGYCTGVGCLEDPTVCPAEWSCFDLSVFQPGLPAICTQP
ncbi:MAG: hypothetical protein WKG01_36500 [Kofleriaceae bacterium]